MTVRPTLVVALALSLVMLGPAAFAGGSLWPAQSECVRPVDEAGYVVQACVGGSICQVVGNGATHVMVCVDPSVCPTTPRGVQLPPGVCRDARDIDADGDGWTVAQGDCDDADPSTHPGAFEHPDGRDNDCNGIVDDTDMDGDGFTVAQGDCDDMDPSTYPGAPEQPGDGADNDCDGEVDEPN